MTRSAIYRGRVTHARFGARPHRLGLAIFMLLIDLDELEALDGRLRLFTRKGFALTGFHETDHGDGSARPLRDQIGDLLQGAGLAGGGAIRVLSMPRILGRVFNPLTVFFCHDRAGALSAILYEVNNTFGQRHSYLIPAAPGEVVRQACAKAFYVSPFMDMDLAYAFTVRPPGEEILVRVEADGPDGPVLSAAFMGRRQALSDRALLGAWLSHPWMTLGVFWAIFAHAVKIWLRGEPLRRRPPPPAKPVSLTPPRTERLRCETALPGPHRGSDADLIGGNRLEHLEEPLGPFRPARPGPAAAGGLRGQHHPHQG